MIKEFLLLLSTRHCQQVTVNWLEANHIHNQTKHQYTVYQQDLYKIHIKYILHMLP